VIPEKNDMHIEGDVETRSSNGYVFRTDSVSYDSKKRVLVSPHEIQMTGAADDQGGRLNLTGTEMMADFGTNDIRINQNVRAKRPVRIGDKNASGANGTIGEFHVVTIQSQRAVFSGRTNLAQFFGNVVIDVETMRLTGPEAKFSYDPKTRSLNSVTVSGGTRVTDTDKFATSGTVEINLKDSRVVFTGDPRVVQNGDELTGDRIVLSDGGKKVEVSNAKAQIDPKRMESH
jgi:lipopolysaccharide transport protein LptA